MDEVDTSHVVLICYIYLTITKTFWTGKSLYNIYNTNS